ncbi:MAG: hypothetical protein GY711_30775 [bacterium]|nr:hypothetical protein [bacterium]
MHHQASTARTNNAFPLDTRSRRRFLATVLVSAAVLPGATAQETLDYGLTAQLAFDITAAEIYHGAPTPVGPHLVQLDLSYATLERTVTIEPPDSSGSSFDSVDISGCDLVV